MLELKHISKRFRLSKPFAVQNVSFSISEHEVFALIGESGSGKSTLAELIVGLQQPTEGAVFWKGAPIQPQAKVQIVFQNPDRSLNPYWKIKDIIAEPLMLNKWTSLASQRKVEELLERVRLPRDLLDRLPAECSGGQKQRVAIARALALEPELLVADEITSALDPMTERDILSLLSDLKRDHNMSFLFITHRLETIRGFADSAAVMHNGMLLEMGTTDVVLQHPANAYTKSLIAACYDDFV
ncbi:ABC transporter ATP-binding protein [Paenibacillus apiarius]|uniref:ATP-binding cassette domain-containing protein n=1 Tax=Paenibacillus apiarius TaxID=46240 RepID=A0ABT4DUX6_9BACL|nr:ATP-binding cassette domain-containing protein [Paenibacillus apiarius]MCY9516388.1 ATP-binding cassette domain-containing protein [Paenibacillus apiarius]MCY9521152.1 ATP-binding cassette domain-containing protein [Paenibacillus apiarius]MCY9551999.1 ATP-binding cassette domain-containing protein [Paenibacillus apiarius]MCY9560944.1 ATP-binding cassette domain-containing protein [Paenibacillus apiarius]MCY9684573.1 ATP-binding cassette domain-containing protein [Paenibacillus apiarius]